MATLTRKIPTANLDDNINEENEFARILGNVDRANKFVGTLQEWIHNNILIPSVIYAWKTKNCNIIKDVLNAFQTQSKASLRLESMAYWYQEFAGFRIEYKKELFHSKANYMGSSAHPGFHLKFTYDVDHLNVLKDRRNRYWLHAPVKIQLVKVDSDVSKMFDALLKKAALADVVEGLDYEMLKVQLNNFMSNLEKYKKDSKILDKAATFFEQHPDKLKEKEGTLTA